MRGTQCVDSLNRVAKRNCHGVDSAYTDSVERAVRENQWHHWIEAADRWLEAGKVVRDVEKERVLSVDRL